MNFMERTMRVMTHLNIGATLATAAWVIGSGTQVVSGQWQIPRSAGPLALPVAATTATTAAATASPPHRHGAGTVGLGGTWQAMPPAPPACDCADPHAGHHPPGSQAAMPAPRT